MSTCGPSVLTLQLLLHVKIMIVSTSSGVLTLVPHKSRVCNDISVGHGHQVLRLTLIGELLSQEKSERIFCIIT